MGAAYFSNTNSFITESFSICIQVYELADGNIR